MADREWCEAQHKALMAVCGALTAAQNAAILVWWAPPGSRLYGAQVADLIDMASDADALVGVLDPFFEEHEDELPDVMGAGYAAYALEMAHLELLSVANVTDLLTRAGLISESRTQ